MGKRIKILYLEDNPVDAELIEYELREGGLEFTSKRVETKATYLKALKAFSPDLILSDYDVPRYDGAKSLAAAKKHRPDVPFILVTGAVTEDRAIEMLTSGAEDYVLKNRLSRLVPAVRRALAEAEEHKARRKAEKELRAAHRSLEKKVKERTAALRASEEEYRLVVEHAPTGIYEIDYEGPRLKRVNDAMCRILGFSREELLAVNPLDLMDDESKARFAERIRRIMAGGEIDPQVSFRIFTREGRELWAALNIKLIYENGRPKGALVVAHDITERRRSEEERDKLIAKLEAANREMERFTASASHDLRAPLQAIDGFSAVLKKTLDGRLDDQEARRFDLIRANIKKMNHLIEDLLNLSRVGRSELVRSAIDMTRLAEEVWEQQREADPERRIELRLNDLPPAFGDKSLVWQVFANLLANAVKFTRGRDNAAIEIGGGVQDSECVYHVKDNGIGFDMQYRDRLFSAFQRLHGESDYEGTGVGLAIVKRIIERHGGRVWAEGRPGGGATLYFTLPQGHPHQT